MIITDYYVFRNISEKSASRFDCIYSTETYSAFETLKNKSGALFLYYTKVPESFNIRAKRKADMILSKSKNISSVYVPDVQSPFAFGDIFGTQDALLIDFTENMEIFIARGQKNNARNLYNLFIDGELDKELESYQMKYFEMLMEKQRKLKNI